MSSPFSSLPRPRAQVHVLWVEPAVMPSIPFPREATRPPRGGGGSEILGGEGAVPPPHQQVGDVVRTTSNPFMPGHDRLRR